MSEQRLIPAIKPTRPRYTHREAEQLMAIILQSGHPNAEHLATKLVTGAEQSGWYVKTLERVRTAITLYAPAPVGLVQLVTRAIWRLKSAAPAGSEHYRSGWDDGVEAAIDAARGALEGNAVAESGGSSATP